MSANTRGYAGGKEKIDVRPSGQIIFLRIHHKISFYFVFWLFETMRIIFCTLCVTGRRTVGLKGRRLGIKVSLYSYNGLNACQEFLSLIFYFHISRVKFISHLAVSSLSCIVSGNWSLQVNSKWILEDNTSRRGPLSLTHCCKHWSLGWITWKLGSVT